MRLAHAVIAAATAIGLLSGCSSDIERLRRLPAGSGPPDAVEAGPPVVIDDSEFLCHAFHLVLFDFGEAAIRPDGQRVLDELLVDLSLIRQQPDLCASGPVGVSVTGHADRAGSTDNNLALSLRRADAVRQALIAGGISADQITVSGRGEEEPAVPTPDGVREQANRRVEIIIQ